MEPTSIAIPADELTLAQLACRKLSGIVQGTLSIGLPAMVSGVPEPRTFLEEQFRVLTGFSMVLHAVACKPGGQQSIFRLRTRSGEILTALENLQRCLAECLDRAEDLHLSLPSARDAASVLCDAIAQYGDLIMLDRSRITKVKEVVLQVFDGIESMLMVAEPLRG